jgi:hypothetical protein
MDRSREKTGTLEQMRLDVQKILFLLQLHIVMSLFTLYHVMKAQRECRVHLYASPIWALGGVDGQHHPPAALLPRKTKHYIQNGRWPQGRCGEVQKILPPPEFEPKPSLCQRYFLEFCSVLKTRKLFFDCSALEFGTNRMPRNAGKHLPICSA